MSKTASHDVQAHSKMQRSSLETRSVMAYHADIVMEVLSFLPDIDAQMPLERNGMACICSHAAALTCRLWLTQAMRNLYHTFSFPHPRRKERLKQIPFSVRARTAARLAQYIRCVEWSFLNCIHGLDDPDSEQPLMSLMQVSKERHIEHHIFIYMGCSNPLSQVLGLLNRAPGLAPLVRSVRWSSVGKPLQVQVPDVSSLMNVLSHEHIHMLSLAACRPGMSYTAILARIPAHLIRQLTLVGRISPPDSAISSLVSECAQLCDLRVHHNYCAGKILSPGYDARALLSGHAPPLRSFTLYLCCQFQDSCECGAWCRWLAIHTPASALEELDLTGVDTALVTAVLRRCCTSLKVLKLQHNSVSQNVPPVDLSLCRSLREVVFVSASDTGPTQFGNTITTVSSLRAESLTRLNLQIHYPPHNQWKQLHEVLDRPGRRSLRELCVCATMSESREVRGEMHFDLLEGLHGFRFEKE